MRYCFIAMIILGLFQSTMTAQEEELELIDAVGKLQESLGSNIIAEREQAEKELLGLGPKILEYLEPMTDEATTDFRERMTRIRTSLEKTGVSLVTQASKLTLKGKLSIAEVIRQIKRQTRNELAVSDDSLLDRTIELDLQAVDFWTAMNSIMQKSGLRIDRYGSRKPGQIMLDRAPPNSEKIDLLATSSMIFQAQVLRVDSSVNLQQPNLDYTIVNLLVRWEPRLRPISVDIPMSDVRVVDEFDDSIVLSNQEEVIYGSVQPEIPEVEFSLRLPRLDRQIETIKSIKASIDAILPGRAELFRFKNVAKLKPGYRLEKAGANVTFGGVRKNEDAYAVKMSLSFDEENNALESHQGWVFQNEVYLLDSRGQREDAISIETLQQDNEQVTVHYYFAEDPGERTLIYKTPAAIVKLPVKIELTNIPLP